MKIRTAISLCLLPFLGWTQLPSTELFEVRFQTREDTCLIESVSYLSANNPGGYNNQPHVSGNGYFLTVADQGNDNTDIVFHDLINNTYGYITSTRLYSEYSPRLVESDSLIYCIRVDTQDRQYLWGYPVDLSHSGMSVLPNCTTAGYYQRISKDSFVVFLTGEPNQLAIMTTSGSKYTFASNIGRTFYLLNGHIYYVHKLTPTTWYLKSFDLEEKRSNIVTKMPPDCEDFVFLDTEEILAASGGQIFKSKMNDRDAWMPLLNLKSYGIDDITRLAIDDGRILLVNRSSDD